MFMRSLKTLSMAGGVIALCCIASCARKPDAREPDIPQPRGSWQTQGEWRSYHVKDVPREDIVLVVEARMNEARNRLAEKPWEELSPQDVQRFCAKTANRTDDAKAYLVRAVRWVGPSTNTMMASILEDESVEVTCHAMGTRNYPTENCAVVIFLHAPPKLIRATMAMTE
jgi:hypothetical protein